MKRTAFKAAAAAAFLAALMSGTPAATDSLVPPPAVDPALGALAAQYDRQFFTFNARPFGLSLDGHIIEAHRSLIAGFFGQGEPFETYASMHPFEVLRSYGEYGDLGMFGGVAAVGDALRYVVLRDSGAPAADVDQAREAVVRAMNSIHVMQAITGEPGVVVRGVMRIAPEEAGAPPIPGCCPETLPLFDGEGNPQPVPKAGTWRDDLSAGGLYPDWVWMDDTSKDQVDGYAAAMGALWDAVVLDPTVPEEAKQALVDDARAWAHKLMTPVPIEVDILGTVQVDMVITDADGRLTNWYGLNPRVIDETTPIVVPEGFGTQNGFNALLGLSVIKVCHHLTGDEDIAAFYYDELIGRRGWLDKVRADMGGVKNMYVGASTNFSNVNMAFTAVYSLLRYEGDAGIRDVYRDVLENHLYRPGAARQAGGLGQSWFDLMFAGLRSGGTDAAAVSEALATLGQFTAPPYFNPEVINCDAAEIAAGTCIAVDGTTVITIASGTGHGDSIVSEYVLPKALRPPSNFEWRSDPHDVNGGGGDRLNPGGDFRAAYWLGRFLQWSDDNGVNVSPFARDRWGGGPTDDVEDAMEDAPVEVPEGWDDGVVDGETGDDLGPPDSATDGSADPAAEGGDVDVSEDRGGGCGCTVVS